MKERLKKIVCVASGSVLSILICSCYSNNAIMSNRADELTNNAVQEQHKSGTYNIEEINFSEGNIKIVYPRIEYEEESLDEKNINILIKDEAFKILDEYEGDMENLYLEYNYSIKYSDNDFLSIVYEGYGHLEDTPYPNNWFKTTNIDLKNVCLVGLDEVIPINPRIRMAFSQGIFKCVDDTRTDKVKEDLDNWIQNLENMNFKNKEIYYYRTNDKLGISFTVDHALGDHIEYEADYQQLLELLENENTNQASSDSVSEEIEEDMMNKQDETYINNEAGFKVDIPKSWDGKYIINEWSEGVEFIHLIDGKEGDVLCSIRIFGTIEEWNKDGGYPDTYIGENRGMVYVARTPSESTYDYESSEGQQYIKDYQELWEGVEAVIGSIQYLNENEITD